MIVYKNNAYSVVNAKWRPAHAIISRFTVNFIKNVRLNIKQIIRRIINTNGKIFHFYHSVHDRGRYKYARQIAFL